MPEKESPRARSLRPRRHLAAPHPAPHIDRERDWVETDLLFVGTATAYVDVDRPHVPRRAANATGDDIVTDGKMSVVELAAVKPTTGQSGDPVLTTRP